MALRNVTIFELNPTYKHFSLFANAEVIDKEFQKLVQAVIDADYENMEAMIDKNLSLIFTDVEIRYHDTNKIERTSLLKIAFKLLDAYMWEMFLEKIKSNPEWLALFLKQKQEQSEHINFDLLLAYQNYLKEHDRWLHSKITNGELKQAWLLLGQKQHELLPAHAVRWFAMEGSNRCNIESTDVSKYPRPTQRRLYHEARDESYSVDEVLHHQDFGNQFTLIGGREHGAYSPGPGHEPMQVIRFAESAALDARDFTNLFNARKKNFEALDQRLMDLLAKPTLAPM